MKKYLFLYLSLLLTWEGMAQENCKLLLQKAYKNLSKQYDVANKDILFTQGSIRNQYLNQGKSETISTDFESYVGRGKIFYKTQEVDILMDKKHVVSIWKTQKLITIGKNGSKNKFQAENIFLVRDTLLNHLNISTCENITFNGLPYKKLTLKPDAKLAKQSLLRKIVFWINPAKEAIDRINMFYAPEGTISSVSITINTRKRVTKNSYMQSSAQSLVLDGSGRLKAAYQNYRLVDQR